MRFGVDESACCLLRPVCVAQLVRVEFTKWLPLLGRCHKACGSYTKSPNGVISLLSFVVGQTMSQWSG